MIPCVAGQCIAPMWNIQVAESLTLPAVTLIPEHVAYAAEKIAVRDCSGTHRMPTIIAMMGIPPVNHRRIQSIRFFRALMSPSTLFKVDIG